MEQERKPGTLSTDSHLGWGTISRANSRSPASQLELGLNVSHCRILSRKTPGCMANTHLCTHACMHIQGTLPASFWAETLHPVEEKGQRMGG